MITEKSNIPISGRFSNSFIISITSLRALSTCCDANVTLILAKPTL